GFVRHFLGSARYWEWVRRTLRAGAQPNINSEEFCSLLIPLPSLNEQRALRQLLDKWDEHISLGEQLVQAKEQHKRGLVQQLLTRKLRFKTGNGVEWRNLALG